VSRAVLLLLALAAGARAQPSPPVISSVTARDASPSGVIVEWASDQAADTEVEYGPTRSYGNSASLNTPPAMSHAIILGGVPPGAQVHYRVKSRNAAGAQGVSPDFLFITALGPPAAPAALAPFPAGGGDGPPAFAPAQPAPFAAPLSTAAGRFPPTVVIMSPPDGFHASGVVTVSANAASGVGTPVVQFLIDGADLAPLLSTAPYLFSWNTAVTGDGPHALAAVARDPAGGSATSSVVRVTVDNTPPALSAINASAVSADGAVIAWTTNEPADSQVEYGQTPDYGQSTPANAVRVVTRGAALSGLASEALYHYRVKSRDAAGLLSVSEDYLFATAEAKPEAAAKIAGSEPAAAAPVPAKAPQKFLTPATADGINDRAVFGPDAAEVTVVDLRGRRIFHAKADGGALAWDCRDGSGRVVPSGVYIAVVVTREGKRVYQSFVVAK